MNCRVRTLPRISYTMLVHVYNKGLLLRLAPVALYEYTKIRARAANKC